MSLGITIGSRQVEKVNRFSESSLEKLENGFQFLFVDGVKVVEIKKYSMTIHCLSCGVMEISIIMRE